jgi:ribosomal-protein-alanine N-acetyltransferase
MIEPIVELVAAPIAVERDLAQAFWTTAQAAYPTGEAWPLASFERDLQAAHRRYVVLTVAGQVVGYLGVIQVLDQVDVTGIAVHPTHQRRGLAIRLFETLLANLDAGTMVFLEVRQSNLPAQRLYQRLGFQVIGTRPAYYQHPNEDAILMKLTV